MLPKKLADSVRGYVSNDLRIKAGAKTPETPKREDPMPWHDFHAMAGPKQRNHYKMLHKIIASQDERITALKDFNEQLVLSSKGHVLAIEAMHTNLAALKKELLKAKLAIEAKSDGAPAEITELQSKLQATLADLAEKNVENADLKAELKSKGTVIEDLQAKIASRSCAKCPLAKQTLSKYNAELCLARGAKTLLSAQLAEAEAAAVTSRSNADALSKQVFRLKQTNDQLKRQLQLRENDSGMVGASPRKDTGLAGKSFGSISIDEESASMDIQADCVQIPVSSTSSPVKRHAPEK